jgi:hypothetical protein
MDISSQAEDKVRDNMGTKTLGHRWRDGTAEGLRIAEK